MPKKFCSNRRKKRSFHGNQPSVTADLPASDNSNNLDTSESTNIDPDSVDLDATSVKNEISEEGTTPSVSASKLASNPVPINSPSSMKSIITGYRIMDMEILADIFSEIACPYCHVKNLILREVFVKRQGSSSLLELYCTCDFVKEFYASKKIGRRFDVNKRIVYSTRTCGIGHNGLQSFCQDMNMPGSVNAPAYKNIIAEIKDATKLVAEETMNTAADELINKSDTVSENEGLPLNIRVSGDGSWQRRGFTSLNGFVSVISMDN